MSCFGPGGRSSSPPEQYHVTRHFASKTSTLTTNRSSSDTLFGLEARRTLKFQHSNTLDVIQDLDLYFIRQIAHSLQEFDLEHKIDLEIKMREGTTKLLAACKHSGQTLEAAKSLVTSNERMAAYMAELQRRKVHERRTNRNSPPSSIKVEPCKAKMAVSDIRMPLIWKDSDHFKNKGDYRRFSVFCLLKVGTEIYDTMMVENVDRSMTDITFDDVVLFNQISSNFEFKLEVYSHVLHNDMSIASTPRKITKRISSSVSRTIGRKLASTLKEELNTFEIGPKFDLVAHATLRLSDAGDDIRTHDLSMENLENRAHQLPLFGHFCCRLAVQPDCVSSDFYAGYLSVIHTVGEVTACRRQWCTMGNFKLSFWAKADESQTTPPVSTIIVNKFSQVVSESPCPNYPLSFCVISETREHFLSADSDVDYHKWIANIRQHCKDHAEWAQAADKVMEIPSPGPVRVHSFLRERHGSSLYDSTPIRGIPESPSQNSILQESNHRMSPPASLRSRSSSTSSAASSLGAIGSQKPNFSFFRFRKNATLKDNSTLFY